MKKIKVASAALALMMALTPATHAAQSTQYGKNINVLLDGKRISFPDVWPQADANQRVLVPIRVVSENLGAKVNYANNKITIEQDGKTIVLTIGSKTATVDGKAVTFDSAAVVKNNRTLVPLRFVSEALGQEVEWVGTDKYVWIGSKDVPSIDDVTKEKPLEDFKNFYGESKGLIVPYMTAVRFFTPTQMPINVPIPYGENRKNVIYNVWLEEAWDKPHIMVHYSGPYLGIALLTGDGIPRLRQANGRTELADGSVIDRFPVQRDRDERFGVDDWEKLQPEDIKYIHFTIDAATYTLLEEPFS